MLKALYLATAIAVALAGTAMAAQPAMHNGGGDDKIFIPKGPGTTTHQNYHGDTDHNSIMRTTQNSLPKLGGDGGGNSSGRSGSTVWMREHHHHHHFHDYVFSNAPNSYSSYQANTCEYLKARSLTANTARSRYWYKLYLRCLNG